MPPYWDLFIYFKFIRFLIASWSKRRTGSKYEKDDSFVLEIKGKEKAKTEKDMKKSSSTDSFGAPAEDGVTFEILKVYGRFGLP